MTELKVIDSTYTFDARGIAKRFRHAAIFGALEALHSGETMRFVNDHDPLPLLAQIRARFGGAIEIRYVERNPAQTVLDFEVLAEARIGAAPQPAPHVHAPGGGCCGHG